MGSVDSAVGVMAQVSQSATLFRKGHLSQSANFATRLGAVVTRAEHRQTTLMRLSDAAIELFAEFGATATFDQIAERAKLSRRTIFRYVEQKEELAFVHPLLWFDVFEAALDDVSDLRVPERLRIASRAIAQHIDDDPEPPRRAFTVIASTPALARGFTGIFQRWVDRIATETLRDIVAPTADDRFRSRIIGSSMMGMVDAVTREWVTSPPTTSFVGLYDDGFSLLAPILGTT